MLPYATPPHRIEPPSSNLSSCSLVVTIDPFFFTAEFPCSSRPSPHGRRPNLCRPTSHAPHRKPAVPRSTRRSRPLANRASVWATSLFRRGFTLYTLIQVSFVCFPISFCFGLSTLHSSFLFYFRLLPANVAAPSSPSSSTRSLSRTLL